MRFLFGMAVGIVLGAVGYWVWTNRNGIKQAYTNRGKIAAGAELLDSAGKFWDTL